MTVQTVHSAHHITGKGVALALVGAALATAVGYGVASLALDAEIGSPTTVSGTAGASYPWHYEFQPETFPGTDREIRMLMHRL